MSRGGECESESDVLQGQSGANSSSRGLGTNVNDLHAFILGYLQYTFIPSTL